MGWFPPIYSGATLGVFTFATDPNAQASNANMRWLGKLVISSGVEGRRQCLMRLKNRSTRSRVRYIAHGCSGALSSDSNAGDHDCCAGSPNPLHEWVSIVALVCDNRSIA